MRASGTRRPHRKSRSGCQQCKQKKIKCDEGKPLCGMCVRCQSECSFSGTLSTAPATSASDAGTRLSRASKLQNLSTHSLLPSSPIGGPPSGRGPCLEFNNLELLHFYTSTTSLTLSNRPELQRIWQHVVPRIAFTHDFLLHGILAFSALHLARSQPERKNLLYAEASAHHDIALRGFQSAMLDLIPQNCDACLAFSTIVAAYSWASSNQRGSLFFSDPLNLEEPFHVEWAGLLRGVLTLLNVADEWMASSSMKLVLYPTDPQPADAADPGVSVKLTELRQLWESSPGLFSDDEVAALNVTLALLLEGCVLVRSSFEVDLVTILYAWPIKVPEVFLSMVKMQRPEALIVLAHYSLMLNVANGIWFMQGMSRHLLQTVHSQIGKEWESWIAWPLQELVLAEFNHQAEN
ncbi:hypothetical protein P154DRAFT_148371 [Amniculicola lignicola CBS 123094]|uniref:Zn(2)-C6 fungal-type domain-containing protein n=1 Tax=Amniculicola lignicola CBS 123094 TaxID=1392246 RepID=A0A6A5VTU1_9PLEO|nr:hypothetical protein P154DRAFT_148371 [Amniculicola lignicola CBS 123094]